jgi:hypothetical protein
MCAAIALKLCTWLYIYDLQTEIKLEEGCYRPIFGRVMPFELSHAKGFYRFHYNRRHRFVIMIIVIHSFKIFSRKTKLKKNPEDLHRSIR